MSNEKFDVEARADHPYSIDDLHIMFQNLLADRFNLKLRRETKEFQVYALVVDKDGPRVRPLKDGEPDTCRMDNSFACGVRTMASWHKGSSPSRAGPFSIRRDWKVPTI